MTLPLIRPPSKSQNSFWQSESVSPSCRCSHPLIKPLLQENACPRSPGPRIHSCLALAAGGSSGTCPDFVDPPRKNHEMAWGEELCLTPVCQTPVHPGKDLPHGSPRRSPRSELPHPISVRGSPMAENSEPPAQTAAGSL